MAGINEPDLYELSCDGVVVTYSKSSFNGSARLSYRESYPDVNAFGPEIRVVATGLGSEVTVDVEAIPDLLVVGPRQTYRVIELSGHREERRFLRRFHTPATKRSRSTEPGSVGGGLPAHPFRHAAADYHVVQWELLILNIFRAQGIDRQVADGAVENFTGGVRPDPP